MRRYVDDHGIYGTNIFQEDLKNLLNVRDEFSSARLPKSLAQQQKQNKLNLELSRSTIFRCLQGSGFLKFVKRQHKPFLMEALFIFFLYKKIRLNWANEVMDSEKNWDYFIISDEKKLNRWL